ncbi:MAG: hypothetical protein JXX28_19965 [Deltaproteobacteria bacterium]|nr:hypothetical protein [Deltaproteobacteria bacterium]
MKERTPQQAPPTPAHTAEQEAPAEADFGSNAAQTERLGADAPPPPSETELLDLFQEDAAISARLDSWQEAQGDSMERAALSFAEGELLLAEADDAYQGRTATRESRITNPGTLVPAISDPDTVAAARLGTGVNIKVEMPNGWRLDTKAVTPGWVWSSWRGYVGGMFSFRVESAAAPEIGAEWTEFGSDLFEASLYPGGKLSGEADIAWKDYAKDEGGGGGLLEAGAAMARGAAEAIGEGVDAAGAVGGDLLSAGADLLSGATEGLASAGESLLAGAGELLERLKGPGASDLLVIEDAQVDEERLAAWDELYRHTLEFWGHAMGPDAVHPIGDAVYLRWDAAWGPLPTSRDLRGDDIAVDAKAAVGAMSALGAWAELSGADRDRLSALIGGETNGRSLAARGWLYGEWSSISAMGASEGAAALTGGLTEASASPEVAEEAISGTAAPYSLAGPQEKAAANFPGVQADAEIWTLTYGDEAGGSLDIWAPKDPYAPGVHQHTVAETAAAAAWLPTRVRPEVKRIKLSPNTNPQDPQWAVDYAIPDFHSYMTANARGGSIVVYPDSAEQPAADVQIISMYHESGHLWSFGVWGTDSEAASWDPWRDAMASDGMSVSQYADAAIAEDVAETVAVYLASYDSPTYDEYEAMVPSRFDILDKEMGH